MGPGAPPRRGGVTFYWAEDVAFNLKVEGFFLG